MQDRYAGDVGDYFKLSLLRHVNAGRRLGIAWYVFPDEVHNSDGRHVSYVCAPERWRYLDPELFDLLVAVISKRRAVAELHRALPGGTLFASEPLPTGRMRGTDRCAARRAWFSRTLKSVEAADIVFADPDNGLTSDEERRRQMPNFGKQIPISEVRALSAGRTAVVYHHNSRFKGGHEAEVDYWLRAIGMPAMAIRATAYSCRTFFVINPNAEIAERTRTFCDKWKDHKVRLHVSSID
ncbi:hypothetical protein [Mesorhizobium caraganae]|uniref:hypothetical protein n=1 Tax=Mesorhizobium caraganae TaxID=483206 RepID=UPI003ECE5FB6